MRKSIKAALMVLTGLTAGIASAAPLVSWDFPDQGANAYADYSATVLTASAAGGAMALGPATWSETTYNGGFTYINDPVTGLVDGQYYVGDATVSSISGYTASGNLSLITEGIFGFRVAPASVSDAATAVANGIYFDFPVTAVGTTLTVTNFNFLAASANQSTKVMTSWELQVDIDGGGFTNIYTGTSWSYGTKKWAKESSAALSQDILDGQTATFRLIPISTKTATLSRYSNFDAVTIEGTGAAATQFPPVLTPEPYTGPTAISNVYYTLDISGAVTDSNGDAITNYAKFTGDSWINVETNGLIYGTPDVGGVTSTVEVVITDATGLSSTNTVNIPINQDPAAPTNIVAHNSYNRIGLGWETDAEPEGDIASYNVYRSTTPGDATNNLLANVTGTDYCDEAVVIGTTYYYAVTVVDTLGAESDATAEVSAVASAVPADVVFMEDFNCNPNFHTDDFVWVPSEATNGQWFSSFKLPAQFDAINGYAVQTRAADDNIMGISLDKSLFTAGHSYEIAWTNDAAVGASGGLRVRVHEVNDAASYSIDTWKPSLAETVTGSNVVQLTEYVQQGDYAMMESATNFTYSSSENDIVVTLMADYVNTATYNIDSLTITDLGVTPTSSGVDLRAFQAADGVYVEFAAYDVEADGTIQLALLDGGGNPVWTGTVEVVAGPQVLARFLVPDLVLGGVYDFQVRDEVGKWWKVDGVSVQEFAAEMTGATLEAVTLALDTQPDREYEIQWTATLAGTWETVKSVTATDVQTTVVVPYPNPDHSAGYFRVRER